MSRKLNLDAGFSKPPVETKTAIEKKFTVDRFAAADQLVAGTANGDNGHAPAASPLTGAETSSQWDVVTEADFQESSSPEYRAWCARNGYKPGTVKTLPLSSVKQSPFNPRHFYRKNSISELALNLSSQGQQDAIHVTPDYEKDGEFFLNDGGRRVRSLREIQAKDVKAIIDDIPQGIKSYKLGYDLNRQHESQTVFDDAVMWKKLLDEKYFESQQALAEEMGVDKSVVTATLSVSELPTQLIEEMLDNSVNFGMNMAYAIVKHFRAKGEKATAALIRKVINEGLSVRKVAELVRRATESSEKAETRQRYSGRVQIKFYGDVHVGDLRTYGEDRLALDLRGLDRAVRDRVQERIEAILAEEGNPEKLV